MQVTEQTEEEEEEKYPKEFNEIDIFSNLL